MSRTSKTRARKGRGQAKGAKPKAVKGPRRASGRTKASAKPKVQCPLVKAKDTDGHASVRYAIQSTRLDQYGFVKGGLYPCMGDVIVSPQGHRVAKEQVDRPGHVDILWQCFKSETGPKGVSD